MYPLQQAISLLRAVWVRYGLKSPKTNNTKVNVAHPHKKFIIALIVCISLFYYLYIQQEYVLFRFW